MTVDPDDTLPVSPARRPRRPRSPDKPVTRTYLCRVDLTLEGCQPVQVQLLVAIASDVESDPIEDGRAAATRARNLLLPLTNNRTRVMADLADVLEVTPA